MNRPNAFRQRTLAPSRRGLLMAGASSAVVFLAACSGATSGSGTLEASSAADSSAVSKAVVSAVPRPGASSAPAASPKAEPAQLVSGFPSTVLPLMPGATLQVSSLEKADPVSSASLTATVQATSAAVMEFYTKSFTDQGFTAQPGDAVDGTPLKTFLRADGQESVTVAVVQNGPTATLTLGATLLAASIK